MKKIVTDMVSKNSKIMVLRIINKLLHKRFNLFYKDINISFGRTNNFFFQFLVPVKCMNDCEKKILFYGEAVNIIKEELGPECCNHPYVITFPDSGFHLLHDFMELNRKHWQRQPINSSNFKLCNLIKIGRTGIPVPVILHAPWPMANQIECWVHCTDENTYCNTGKAIAASIDAVLLGRKCSIQYYCEHEDCKGSRHLSSPNPTCPKKFVCNNTSKQFSPRSSKNLLLARMIPCRSMYYN